MKIRNGLNGWVARCSHVFRSHIQAPTASSTKMLARGSRFSSVMERAIGGCSASGTWQNDSMSEYVTSKIDGHVGVCTLNRPEVLNALNVELMDQLIGKLEAFGQRSEHSRHGHRR